MCRDRYAFVTGRTSTLLITVISSARLGASTIQPVDSMPRVTFKAKQSNLLLMIPMNLNRSVMVMMMSTKLTTPKQMMIVVRFVSIPMSIYLFSKDCCSFLFFANDESCDFCCFVQSILDTQVSVLLTIVFIWGCYLFSS